MRLPSVVALACVLTVAGLKAPARADSKPVGQDEIVGVSASGYFHRLSCDRLPANHNEVTLREAMVRGEPCPICEPLGAKYKADGSLDPQVVADYETRTYHAKGCPLIGKKADTFALSLVGQSYKPCPKCKPAGADVGPEAVAAAQPSGGTTPSSSGEVYVKGYRKKDGTYVKPHTRKKPKS